MSTPNFATEAAAAGNYPSQRFNARERKLLKSVADALGSAFGVIAAGSFTTVGGDANESITVSGALSTDIAIVVLKTAGATPRTVVTSAAAAGAIDVVLSGDPSNDHVLSYILIRAAA